MCGAGVLFLLPSLLEQGLLKTSDVYSLPSKHYYGLESVVLTLSFMALGRIKNPEQLKQCKPGELGKIIGLDRIPEVRCLRNKIKLLTDQQKATKLNNLLIDHWYAQNHQDASFMYIDGHQRIYYGHKANLPVKYISRQKLCLSATTEYWVNDATGMPVMMVMGQLTEKLQTAIETYIIPQMQQTNLLVSGSPPEQNIPQCTFIFDREAYEPAFFQKLWDTYRIAVITYRKNVKDSWDENSFNTTETKVLEQAVTMSICEQQTELGGYTFREIRRLSKGGHQTAIITTHPTLDIAEIAGRMFGRWIQENFFKYLIHDYDFDKMIQFGIEHIDPEQQVVNPQYRKINNRLKKLREKKQRMEAKFYPLAQLVMEQHIEQIPAIIHKQAEYKEILDKYQQQESELINLRKQYPPKITLKQMPDQTRYNKLKTESKLLINVIKMICYRAESAVASLIAPNLSREKEEKRMVVKQIIANNADLIPDYINKTLTVKLHSLSAPRFNLAAHQVAILLNQTQTIFPGTDLRMIFNTTANSDCEG
ncbi:MAG: hypothetical protein COB88_08030 [Flavobacteriales bacterium]|nr:MAG: hypothetical protein COB88_08030 [Flavobacteriales bacterium]